MGYYIEAPTNKGKAKWLQENHEAKPMLRPPTFPTDGRVAIVVIDNGPFEAAGICYSEQELTDFNGPGDPRPKTWLTITKEKAIELCPSVRGQLANCTSS